MKNNKLTVEKESYDHEVVYLFFTCGEYVEHDKVQCEWNKGIRRTRESCNI